MIIRNIRNCEYFEAMDKTILCELLHPDREDSNLKIDLSVAHAILKPLKSSIPINLKILLKFTTFFKEKELCT